MIKVFANMEFDGEMDKKEMKKRLKIAGDLIRAFVGDNARGSIMIESYPIEDTLNRTTKEIKFVKGDKKYDI